MEKLTYELFSPPITRNFTEIKPKEAHQYFEWFVAEIPNRLFQLQKLVDQTSDQKIELNKKPFSLMSIDIWFPPQVEVRSKTLDKQKLERLEVPGWLFPFITDDILTEMTISICVDTGIYFAEVLITENHDLQWHFLRSPKRAADLYRPVLKVPNNKIWLNPLRVVNVIAHTVMQGNWTGEEFSKLFQIWYPIFSAHNNSL